MLAVKGARKARKRENSEWNFSSSHALNAFIFIFLFKKFPFDILMMNDGVRLQLRLQNKQNHLIYHLRTALLKVF